MRESELRDWIEELAEDQSEKERQRWEQREREQQTLEEQEQRRLEQMKQEFENQSLDPEPLIELDDEEDELREESREERRAELIAHGEEVDLPNESSAFISGSTSQFTQSTLYHPYYVEVRGRSGDIEHSTYDPEPVDIVIDASPPSNVDSTTVNWWFSFTPDETRHWNFRIHTSYRGFYRLTVNPHWFWTKSSRAVIIEEARAHQYNPGPKEERTRLDQITYDQDISERFDQVFTQNYGHLLAGGDTALLHVHQRFVGRGHRGSGTNAEIDFGTGTGNRVPVPYVYIS